jgi:hypothetical protein
MATRAKVFWVLVTIMILFGLIYSLPPVRNSLSFNFGDVSGNLHNVFFPPDLTMLASQAHTTGTPGQGGPSLTPGTAAAVTLTPTAGSSPTPLVTATPLPGSVALKGFHFIDQHGLWIESPPASLATLLSLWGWTGTFENVDKYVKPFQYDYNVMPYELSDYVTNQTKLSVVIREGGNLDVLKRLVASGYPVLIEKGITIKDTTTGKSTWMNHYNVVSGYNEAAQQFVVQDPAYQADLLIKYDTILQDWRPFDYIFLVVYPPEKEKDLMSVLGDYADESNGYRIAYNTATQEINSTTGVDTFFAWFNRGTSQVNLQDYSGAADSYDQAFAVYAKLSVEQQPFQMMWYQTGPYFAYYYMFRYDDLITLANQTISSTTKPYLEESYYWRGRAERANGDTNGDIADQRLALKYHPGFQPSLDELKQLGITN